MLYLLVDLFLVKKVKIRGVTQQNNKGIPTCVHQYEVRNEKNVDEQRNAIKVMALEGDPLIKDLVAISYHDPIYWISKKQSLMETCSFGSQFGAMR